MSKKPPEPKATSSLTAIDDARDRLKSFDLEYLEHLDRMSRYTMGEKGYSTKTGYFTGVNGFPIFSTAAVYTRKIGASRRMLNIQLLNLSKFTGNDPVPDFPELDDAHVGDMRAKFYRKRSKGDGKADGGWDGAIEQAFVDGNGYGYGFVALGKRRNPKTKKFYVDADYIPSNQVIWEPLEPRFGKSSWVGMVRYISKAEALARYNKADVEKAKRNIHDVSENITYEYVRVVEYYDIGYGLGYDDSKPTYMVWLGDWDDEPIVREENPYGILPVAHYEHFIPKGKARAIGVVDQQIAICEAINDLEDQLLKTAKRFGIDLIDVDQVDKQDMKRWAAGDPTLRFIKWSKPAPNIQERPVVQHVPADEVGNTLLQLMSLYERQFNADSSSADSERGQTTETKRTATELSQLAAGAQLSGGSTRKATLKLYQRMMEIALKVAVEIDNDPVVIELEDGGTLTINDPTQPMFSIEEIMKEPSSIVILPQSIEGTDVEREKQQKLAELQQLMPFVQMGVLVPQKVATEFIKALKLGDPKDWLVPPPQPQPMMPPGMAPGMPQQGQPMPPGMPQPGQNPQ